MLGNGTKPWKLASAPVSIALHADAVFCGVTVTVAVLVTEPLVLVAVSV